MRPSVPDMVLQTNTTVHRHSQMRAMALCAVVAPLALLALLPPPTSATECGVLNDEPSVPIEVSAEAKGDTNLVQVNVLAMYTDDVVAKYGEAGASELAAQFMNQAQQEYLDSDTGVLLQTVGIVHVSVDATDSNISHDPRLLALRSQYQASLGILITTSIEGYCGLASVFSGSPMSWLGKVKDVCPQATAHEIGHLFGANHGKFDPASSAPAQCYQALYDGSDEGFGTIMCGGLDNPGFGWEKLRYFSDPSRTLDTGEALGDAECDNIGVIKTTRSAVADFKNSLPMLLGERFLIETTWRDFAGNTGVGTGVQLTSDSGYFWFFGESNIEVVVKTIDACSFNDRFWIFSGAMTNVQYTITVTDTLTGVTKEYSNPLGNRPRSITDTDAFATCSTTP